MITYSSYLKKKTDLGGTGLVSALPTAALSCSLVSAYLPHWALWLKPQAKKSAKWHPAVSVWRLFAFPTIINQAPMGALIGVLFFGSLVFAGVTFHDFHR